MCLDDDPKVVGFNPLTGISSILTIVKSRDEAVQDLEFQSPDGDFVYSDLASIVPLEAAAIRFNPLTGISSILTRGSSR